MSEAGAPAAREPRYFRWAAGALFGWSCATAFDYLMVQAGSPGFISGHDAADRAYLRSYPLWMDAVWCLGVASLLLGAVLLLRRRRWAYPALAAGLAATLASAVYGYALADRAEVLGGPVWTAVEILASLAVILWVRAMARRGVLR